MRKVCVVTGTRAEYGLLRNLMAELNKSDRLELQVLATGAHLSEIHGSTIKEIQNDGFQIDDTVHMVLASDSRVAIGASIGLAVIGLTKSLSRLKPDILVVLGDRYEALAAAQSAMILRIPIAHIHGGEATEGLIDEAIRHSITKMSHLHFVAAEPYRKRVIQLGEQPDKVYLVGATCLDNINFKQKISLKELENFLEIKLSHPLLLVTYHPVTLENDASFAVDHLLEALDFFPDATIIFTGSNADPSGIRTDQKIGEYCTARPERSKKFVSLGAKRYLELMSISDAVVGNSSSGILEAPAVGTPTVNIGSRQQGRLKAPSVIDVQDSVASIRAGITKAMTQKMRQLAARRNSPFGKPGVAKKITQVLGKVDLENILIKRFNDL